MSTPESKVESEVKSATGWIRMHMAWAIGLGCFLFGVIVGYVGHLHR